MTTMPVTTTQIHMYLDGRNWTEAEMAREINEQHRACQTTYEHALSHAYEAGRLLAEIKEHIPHGEWEVWIDQNVELSLRTAQVYVQVASSDVLKAQTSAPTSISAALKQISTPRPERRLSSREMGSAFAESGGLPAERRDSNLHQTAAEWNDQQRRKDQRAREHLVEAEQARDQAHHTGFSQQTVARLLRDAAIRAQRAAALFDELAISFE